jgi:hypothetical protein
LFVIFDLKNIVAIILSSLIFVFFGLAIAAIVCGGIDLKRIKAGLCIKQGKDLYIAGIVLGSVFILFALFLHLGK